jgi:hypothetical protein
VAGRVDHHARADEPVDRQLVETQPVRLEVVRRVHVRPRLGPDVHVEQVEPVALDRAVDLEARLRVAGIDDGPRVDPHRQVDDAQDSHGQQLLHVGKQRSSVRRNFRTRADHEEQT